MGVTFGHCNIDLISALEPHIIREGRPPRLVSHPRGLTKFAEGGGVRAHPYYSNANPPEMGDILA